MGAAPFDTPPGCTIEEMNVVARMRAAVGRQAGGEPGLDRYGEMAAAQSQSSKTPPDLSEEERLRRFRDLLEMAEAMRRSGPPRPPVRPHAH